ncbi:MAG: glucosamine-6-phosphate deaminase [Candidatus Sumerlaeaceae bacterium]
MKFKIFDDKLVMAEEAAAHAANILRTVIAEKGSARMIAATGASQFEFLDHLTAADRIDWNKVEMFHLDEYVGLPLSHPASFRKYLLERLIHKAGISKYHLLDGEANPQQVCEDMAREINRAPIDVAFVGIGENGHLAFNDPPADFETEQPYIVVQLDEACRNQQFGEGWFPSMEAVPATAISMSIRQILKAREIICIAPDERKANAVKNCLGPGEPSPVHPASALKLHPNTTVYLDQHSAALLPDELKQSD